MTRFVGTPLRGIEFANNGDEAISTRIVGDAHAKIRIDAGGRITWSSGDSAGDTNLYRDEANVLKTDDVFIGAGGIVTIATNGAPSQELANGAVAVDITNNVFYFRSDDEWIKVANSDDATSITISTTEPESPVNGELWFDSDDELLKIYNSGSWVNLTGAKKLDDLSDVDLTVLPLDGDVLKYNSSSSVWVSGSVAAGGATVTISDNPPEEPDNGDLWFESDSLDLYIYYNDAFLQLTDTSSGVTDITDLSDVQIDNPLIGQVLVYDGADWINETLSASVSNINDIGNVQITSASVSQVLQFDGTNWVNATFSGGAANTDELPEGLVNLYFTAARVLSALPQDISASASPTFATVNADLSGNASTATSLETARIISLSGDVSGSASFDGTSNVTISTTVAGGGSGLTDTDDLPEGSTNLYFSEERVILALPQDISASASPTFSTVNADLSGNALTSTSLETARAINLGGDLSGSASFDGSSDITITASVGADAVELGVNTTGNYVSDVTSGTGVSVSHTPGEGSSPTISIGQDVSSSASVTFSQVSANLLGNVTGNVTGDLTGNADTATALETSRAISLSGDLSGSVSFDGSSDVTISATIQPDSVALGTGTTGDYVQSLVAGTNVALTNNSGEGATPTVTVSGDLTLIDSISTPDYIQFDPTHIVTSASAGRLQWSADEGTLEIALGGDSVNLQIGSKNVVYAKNGTGSTINRGKSIMAVGAVGDRISIALAVANGSIDSRYMLGIAAEDIADDSFGYVVTNGYIRNINTSAWPVGTILYFDPQTPGGITTTEPDAPNLLLPIAIVVKQNASSGIIYVRMTLGGYLRESHDVSISTPASGDFLKYNGSVWVNDAINLGTDTEGNYLIDVIGGTGVIVTHTPGEGSSASIEIGQDVGTSASVSFAQVQTTGDVVIGGDLTVNGNTTTLNTETLVVEDNIIVLNGNVTGSPVLDAGIEIERGTSDNVQLRWNESTDSWEITEDGTTYKNIAVGQDVETSSSVTFAHVSADVTGDLTGNADTASTLETTRTISLVGDVSGSVSFDGSSNVSISASIQADSVELGIDTTGDYVADVIAGAGIGVIHTPGEGSSATIELNAGINELKDVFVDFPYPLPTDGQFLQYNSASLGWVAADVPTINTLDDIGDVSVSSASAGQFLKYDGADWIPDSIVGGASISGSAPESPTEGQLWFDSDTAQTFVYYDSQWIEIGVSGTAISVSEAAPSSPVNGQLWFNSASGGTFVYYGSASVWVEIGAAQVDNLLNLIDNKGDLLVGISDGALNSVPIGSDGQILVANSSASVGVEWQTPDYASTGKAIAMAIVFSG